MPKPGSPRPTIRKSVRQLSRLLEQPSASRKAQWYDDMGERLEWLEIALQGKETQSTQSESLEEITRAHPRLISLCDGFHREGRRLLRQTALVVRLSLRSYDGNKAPFEELDAATASLIDAVERFLAMEGELAGEAAQDIGGEG